MNAAEYRALDATALAEAIATGDLSPAEALDAALHEAKVQNPTLNAIVWDMAEQARASLDALPDGPFRGVPFLVKDLNLGWAGSRTTGGSRFTRDVVVEQDDPLASGFRASGVVAIGKSNTPEFGITGTTESALLGPCRNPFDPGRISGGSSGGSASAVAAGIVPVAHASDGAGSIRIPAACCGLVGLMPSRGRTLSPGTAGDVFHSYSRHFVVSRSVRDSARMLDAVADNSPYAPPRPDSAFAERRDPGRLRIHVSAATPSGRPVHPEVAATIDQAAALLDSLGHAVEDRTLPVDLRTFYRHFGVIGAAQLAADVEEETERLGREPGPGDFEPLTERNLAFGRSRSGARVIQAMRVIRAFTRSVDACFRDIDVYVTPVLGTPVPEIGYLDPNVLEPKEQDRRSAETFPFTPPFNATGQPAISLPMGVDGNGLPIGLQFVGRYGDEATLLQLAYQLEEAQPWAQRLPALTA